MEQINVSDKAVSKWERGDGCPEVSVIPALAKVSGVEVENILNGELPPSKNSWVKEQQNRKIKLYDFRHPYNWGKEDLRAICNFFMKSIPFVEFGRFNSENVNLEVGKIYIFDKKFYDPLNLVYKNKVIFQGEAVVIDDNFGVRITELI